MKMSTAIVAVVISYNDVEYIDRTIESLRRQTFPREQFYIVAVDFGSTDGTYEKLLTYDRYHLGVYQFKNGKKVRPEQYPLFAAGFAGTVGTSDIKYYFTLRAGDTVVPEISSYCSELLIKYRADAPVMVICEANVENADASVTSTPPMFSEAFMLDGAQYPMELSKRGYGHRVFYVGGLPSGDVSYRGFVPNDRTRWNNLFYHNFRRNSLYIPKVMATIRDRPAEDTMFILASTYAMLLFYVRHSQNMYADALGESEYTSTYRNLAHLALYHACLEFNRGNVQKAEDCLLFSSVIFPEIFSDKLYADTADYISGQGPEPVWEADVTLPPPLDAVRIGI